MKNRMMFALLLLSAASLMACGGGGGGGGGSPYTGIRTQAVITGNNFDNVAMQVYEGADFGTSAVALSPAGEDGGDRPPMPRTVSVALTLKSAADAVLRGNVATRSPVPRAVDHYDNTFSDGRGGSVHATLSVDDQTGDFSGTFAFTGWHGDGGGQLTGPIAVSGRVDLGSYPELVLESVRFSFGSVTVSDGQDTARIAGTFDITVSGSALSVTANLYLTDAGTGKTVWFDDFRLFLEDGNGYVAVQLNGRIYLHDFGYVDVATATWPFVYTTASSYPTQGILRIAGSGHDVVTLTVIDTTNCRVDFDDGGDGSVDGSVIYYW